MGAFVPFVSTFGIQLLHFFECRQLVYVGKYQLHIGVAVLLSGRYILSREVPVLMQYLCLKPAEYRFNGFTLSAIWGGKTVQATNLFKEVLCTQLFVSALVVVYDLVRFHLGVSPQPCGMRGTGCRTSRPERYRNPIILRCKHPSLRTHW